MLKQIDLSRIDLNLLVLFETVFEERHVGRSANRLRLSSSAVSHGLKRLRALLGDPLFLRTPRGVVPTERAISLAPAIIDILAQIRKVVATAQPFDPARSRRRFAIAAPDGVSSVFIPGLLNRIEKSAPGIDISLRQLLPRADDGEPDLAWRDALSALEARQIDIAVVPSEVFPARFAARMLFEEEFVIAMRAGHPSSRGLDLDAYLQARHILVSHTGDAFGIVDTALAERGLSRRIALTAPNFMFALGVLAENDYLAALPARFVAIHANRFGLVTAAPPIALPRYRLNLVVLGAALADEGLAWMVQQLEQS